MQKNWFGFNSIAATAFRLTDGDAIHNVHIFFISVFFLWFFCFYSLKSLHPFLNHRCGLANQRCWLAKPHCGFVKSHWWLRYACLHFWFSVFSWRSFVDVAIPIRQSIVVVEFFIWLFVLLFFTDAKLRCFPYSTKKITLTDKFVTNW